MISHVPGSSLNGERMTIHLLAEYAEAAHVPTRQSAAGQILEALQLAVTSMEAYSEQEDVEKVFAYINKLSLDNETIVRCNLLSTLPKVASFCAEYDSPLVSLKELIEIYILPIVLKSIADEDGNCNMRVRKEAYNVLKYLLNNNLVNQTSIENTILDLFTSLFFHRNDIINLITAGNFIARMAPVVGEATTEKLLLPKISDLCTNQYTKVREACVHYLIDIACHVNLLVTENIIIPLFIKLSVDETWCVRKACAETIVMLSCLCLMETRKTVLTRVFLDLILDSQRPVELVACKQLGPFMTSFAQPALIALGSNRNGDYLLIHSQSGSSFELMSRRSLFQFYEQPDQNTFSMFMLPMKPIDNGVNEISDSRACDMSNEEQTNAEIGLYGDEQQQQQQQHTYCMNDIEENVTDDNAYYTNASEECSANEDGVNVLFKLCGLDIDSGDQFTRQSDDGAINNNEYENQPDLVQSCLNVKKVWTDYSGSVKRGVQQKRGFSKAWPVAKGNAEADCFNSFQFWREPIPEFDERDLPATGKTECEDYYAAKNDYEIRDCDMSESRMNDCEAGADAESSGVKCYGFYARHNRIVRMEEEDWKNRENFVKGIKRRTRLSMDITPKQNVLPQALLNAYIKTVGKMDFNLKMHCAYNFPAVVLTLGSTNWQLVKESYTKLATDSDRQIRQMVASSIHEIASILGPELATEDLIPIYNSLMNDIEDIRITALNHLSCFVKLLKPHGRCQFLPHLMEYMMTDYVWNWRFRKQLSEQLIEMMDFFAPTDCWKYVSPVAFTLLMDRVSAVRLQALNLVTHLIRVVSVDLSILRGILAELAEQFAHSTQWTRRQSFAFLCSSLLRTPVLPDDMFARDVLPHLLDLSWDSIPNVRIAVARTLSCDVITYPYFSNVFSPHYDVLTQVLKRLYKDKDRDVRYFASLNTSSIPPLATFEVS